MSEDAAPAPAPPSSQSPSPLHFRESDVEFLQQQARIWLEAVVGERFDEDTSLADLLADGEILHRISLTIRALLQRHSDGEPASPKSLFPEASFYGKHSGKYLPYSNVDSFLKVCQKLGLTGVDLFSPPDVVEKKDVRRVCLCIRALSKKARARQLGVPNFDYVTHNIAMPTEFVGNLRDYLTQTDKATNSPCPRDFENKETQEKALFSPSDDCDVGNKVTGDTLRVAKVSNVVSVSLQENSDNVEASKTSHMAEWDPDLFTQARRVALFKDDNVQSQGSSFDMLQDEGTIPSVMKHSELVGSSDIGSFEKSSIKESLQKGLVSNHSSRDPSKNYLEDANSQIKAGSDASELLPAWKVSGKDKKDTLNPGKTRKKRTWLPVVAATLALLGVVAMIRAREPPVYEVKQGDTLSAISRRTGKSSWEELARLNPGIRNPDLIYPSERLRLSR